MNKTEINELIKYYTDGLQCTDNDCTDDDCMCNHSTINTLRRLSETPEPEQQQFIDRLLISSMNYVSWGDDRVDMETSGAERVVWLWYDTRTLAQVELRIDHYENILSEMESLHDTDDDGNVVYFAAHEPSEELDQWNEVYDMLRRLQDYFDYRFGEC